MAKERKWRYPNTEFKVGEIVVCSGVLNNLDSSTCYNNFDMVRNLKIYKNRQFKIIETLTYKPSKRIIYNWVKVQVLEVNDRVVACYFTAHSYFFQSPFTKMLKDCLDDENKIT
jgi:hypothetical protein